MKDSNTSFGVKEVSLNHGAGPEGKCVLAKEHNGTTLLPMMLNNWSHNDTDNGCFSKSVLMTEGGHPLPFPPQLTGSSCGALTLL